MNAKHDQVFAMMQNTLHHNATSRVVTRWSWATGVSVLWGADSIELLRLAS